MIEPVAVGVHALRRSGCVKDKKVLVFGAGPIGNLTAQVAKGMGARAVMITDLSDFRLNLARQCGIDFAVNTRRQDISQAIGEHFGPDKADLILECVGAGQTITQAIDNARKGTDIVVVGVFGDLSSVNLGLVQDRELRLIGTAMYQECDFIEALGLVNAGFVNLASLVTDRFGFKDYIMAYEKVCSEPEKTMKVIINL